MCFEAEFNFFLNLMKNFHLTTTVLTDPYDQIAEIDLGLRRLIHPNADFRELFSCLPSRCKPNTIYRIYDEFMCRYILFKLPDMDIETFLFIGPYTLTNITLKGVLNSVDKLTIPPELFPQLEKFYQDLPLISNESVLLVVLNTFGEKIWGSMDNFTLKDFHYSFAIEIEPVAERPAFKEPEDAFLSMKILEERYASENRLMQAVSQGQAHKAEMYMMNFVTAQMEKRVADPLRNIKNYTIILNTLLRKAVEAGAVHPLHIDSLSSRFAKQIELMTSARSAEHLQKEMVYKYCLLVKNHSMKGYSLLIRKVLTRIDSDLTADLNLKTQAELLNVNASYLSTLFKKETGSTLTEYVNRKRVEHAIFLLNSTNMQIQMIAQYCGIPDVNYFTKLFKKNIGKTPKEYRDSIKPYK